MDDLIGDYNKYFIDMDVDKARSAGIKALLIIFLITRNMSAMLNFSNPIKQLIHI